MLPVGYRFVQDIENRFGSHYRVAERFLKSENKVWDVVRSQREQAESIV